MNQTKDLQYWRKRKAELERAVKTLVQKREKTLYLFEVEKQSRRKTRELQLRTLLEYETRELQQAQAELQAINDKMTLLQKEQQKHSLVKVIGLFSLLVMLCTFAGLVWYNDEAGDNTLTGAVVSTLPAEETILINEYMNTSLEPTMEVNNEPSAQPEMIRTESSSIGMQEISIQNAPSIAIVLNTTNLASNDTNVNLTAYNTSQTDGNSLKVIYNWLRNTISITLLNMPFEGINGTSTNNAWDYSGLGNTGSENGGVLWNASGGYDGKGAYQFDGVNDYIGFTTASNPSNISMVAWIKPLTSATVGEQAVLDYGSALFTINLQNSRYNFYPNVNLAAIFCSISPTLTSGQLYHVAVTYNYLFNATNGNISCYLNGALVQSKIHTVTDPTGFSFKDIGRYGGNSRFFNGTIDEVIVFNRTLSPQEIYALWVNQSNTIAAEETFRGENWTIQATPNNGTGDGTVVISNNLTIANAKPAISTLVLNSTNISSNRTEVNLTAYATTSDADSDSVKVIYNWLRNAISITLLNMPFEGVNRSTNTTWDYSGLSNTGSENSGVLWNASGGYDGKGAYQFDGVNDYIGFTTASNPSNISMVAWIKPLTSATVGEQAVLDYGSAMFTINVPSSSYVFYPNVGQASITCSISPTLTSGQLYHVAVTYNYLFNATNGNISCYLNGALVQSKIHTVTDPTGFSLKDIGRYGGNSRYFNGTIDEVIVFNRTLSPQEIYALWVNQSNTIAAEETFRGENWTVQGTPNDGTDDGALVISNNLTILNTGPLISTLVLNTTNVSSNRTEVNLTAYATTSDADNDSVRVIYNWLVNGSPMAILNMPFEGINNTPYNNTWDYSGLGNHGNDSHSARWNATGGYDRKGAYDFDGDDFINLTNQHYFESVCNSGCTFTSWIKWGNKSNTGMIVARRDSSLIFFTFSALSDNMRLQMEIGFNGTNTGANKCIATSAASLLQLNAWQHVAGRYNGTHTSLFINGTQQAATACTFTAVNYTTWQAVKVNTHIGNLPGLTANGFNGTLDDVIIFNRSLSKEQIYALSTNQTNVIVAQETQRGENWTVQATPNDGTDDGTVVISNNVTILNTAPTSPVLWNLTNGTTVTTRTPTFVWNVSSDTDGDAITYRIQIDDNILFNNLEVNAGGITNTTADNVTYTLSTELSVDTSYFWRVLANDSLNDGSISATRNFTVQSYLAINVTDETAAFGTLPTGANVSTPNNASSLRAENVGNIIANVTVTGTNLFGFNSFPSSFYRFKIRANESGAFNTTASATEWNQTNSTLNANIFHVINLDWHDASNDFLTDLNISVPLNESAGYKSSVITFTITG